MHRHARVLKRSVPLVAVCMAVALNGCGDDSLTDKDMTFNNGKVYYTDNVTEAEVTSLGNYLVKRGFFNSTEKSVTLDKSENRYKIFVLAEEGLDKDVGMLTSFRNFSVEISKNAFNDAKVDMYLVDKDQKTQTLIPAPDYGTRLTFNGSDLFYTASVTETEAKAFGNYLVTDGFFAKPQTAQLNREKDTFQFRFMVEPGRQNDAQFQAVCTAITTRLSHQVFGDAPVEIHLCDHNFQTLKVITQPAA